MIATVQKPKVEKITLNDDSTFPNNDSLPLVLYRNVLRTSDPAEIEKLFNGHNWVVAWRDGIYDYHHYHSTAHEVVGVFKGTAMVIFGGEQGVQVELNEGDVAVIPAGVAHKTVNSSYDFKCVGAYPKGQACDMNYGKAEERPEADKNIRRLAIPKTDPVYGINGPLMAAWLGKPEPVIYGVSKENAYRRELENQMEDSSQVKHSLSELTKTYNRGFIDKWFTGSVFFVFECIFYLLFIVSAIMTGGLLFADNVVISLYNVLISSDIFPDDAAMIITLTKVSMVVISLFWLCIGLTLGVVRTRNAWIDSILAEINRDIKIEEKREQRIREVL